MLEQTELEWLAAERPTQVHLDPHTTARVREELLAHIADPHARARPRTHRTRRTEPTHLTRRTHRALRIAISASALAALAAAALLAGQSSTKLPIPGPNERISVQPAASPRLVLLSDKLAAAPRPAGDATLVLRRQVYPTSPEIDGADLYADNGNYYYATELSGLPAVIKAGQTVNTGTSDQEVRDMAAAHAALTGPIAPARHQMSIANLDPNIKPSNLTPAQAIATLPPALRQKIEAARRNAQAHHEHSEMSQENGMIWDNSMDALLAGAGDPQVRAGVLKLLATIPQITVAQGMLAGQPTLVLSAALLSSDQGVYQEQLIINANTGIPVKFIGGNIGQTPGVTVYYSISRVTVAAVESGR